MAPNQIEGFSNETNYACNVTECTTRGPMDFTCNVFETYPAGLLTFAASSCILFTLIGIPGNLITVMALLRTPKLRNATTAFIVNLCVADGIFCATSLPLAASTFLRRQWIYGEVFCVLFPMLRYSNIAVSLFTVTAITVNRYVLICHPNQYRYMYSKPRMVFMIFSLWFFAWALLFPPLVRAWGCYGFDPSVGTCSILPINGRSPKNFLYIAMVAVPSVFFLVCYTRIWMVVRNARRKVSNNSRYSNPQDMRVLKVVLVIFITFLVCFLPVVLVKIMRIEDDHPVANIFAYFGVFLHACINPLIYVVMSKEYRKAYIALFKGPET